MRRARQEVAIAERLLDFKANLADPASWAELADEAAVFRTQAQRVRTVRATIDRVLGPAQYSPVTAWATRLNDSPSRACSAPELPSSRTDGKLPRSKGPGEGGHPVERRLRWGERQTVP